MYSKIQAYFHDDVVERVVKIIIILMHLAGFIGLQYPDSQSFFKLLVPFHLLTSLALVFMYHEHWHRSALLFFVVAYCAGFVVEWLGVHTGVIFGQYLYGDTLGFKLWKIPVVIGVNWLTLIYCAGVVVSDWVDTIWSKAFVAAALVVGLDVLIEPVAMRLDFWGWTASSVPFQNYVAWYIVALGLLLLFYRLPFQKKNKLAGVILTCQAIFFVAHNITYILKK
jgi:bisanhydrobacterioruberin hydratase